MPKIVKTIAIVLNILPIVLNTMGKMFNTKSGAF